MKSVRLIIGLLLGLLASLAPLFFVVGVIAAFDRYASHQTFLENLSRYGRETQGIISYVDLESRRAGVDYLNADGQEQYGVLRLEYYPDSLLAGLQPGQPVSILYIDALVSGYEQTALSENLSQVQNHFPVSPDIFVMLVLAWLVIMLKPQFVFLGLVDFNQLMSEALQ